jgi:hypothetical protein
LVWVIFENQRLVEVRKRSEFMIFGEYKVINGDFAPSGFLA